MASTLPSTATTLAVATPASSSSLCSQAIITTSIITALVTALVLLLALVLIRFMYKHRLFTKKGSNPGALASSRVNTGVNNHIYVNHPHDHEMSSVDVPTYAVSNGEEAGHENVMQEREDEEGSYADVSDGYYMEVIDNPLRNLQIQQNQAYSS